MNPLAWLGAAIAVGEVRAARRALRRCYYVVYLGELSSREHHGMILLEGLGLVHRDEGLTGLHWHLTDAGRRWVDRPLWGRA